MSDICSSCRELKETSPEFVQQGVTDKICASLKNNTGLNPSLSVLHDDEQDLNLLNDCLIGQLTEEIDSYNTCDWKEYMKRFGRNLYQLIKAMICSIVGLWKNIDKIWCWLEHINTPSSYTLHAYTDDDPTKAPINGFWIADGVRVRTDEDSTAMRIKIAGNNAYITGSLIFDGNMPTDYTNGKTVKWTDFYAGGTEVTTKYGWKSSNGNTPGGGFLIYKYEVNPCDYGFKDFFTTHLLCATGGDFVFRIKCIHPGETYDYPCGYGENYENLTYNPSDKNLVLIECRMENVRTWGISNGGITPNGVTGVIPCKAAWSC